jgi:phosphatidylinositol-bisphosphatase
MVISDGDSQCFQKYTNNCCDELGHSTTMGAEEAIRTLLRSSEEVKVALETVSVPSSNAATANTTVSNLHLESYGPQDLQHRRILAVVSHRDDWKDSEEGR